MPQMDPLVLVKTMMAMFLQGVTRVIGSALIVWHNYYCRVMVIY